MNRTIAGRLAFLATIPTLVAGFAVFASTASAATTTPSTHQTAQVATAKAAATAVSAAAAVALPANPCKLTHRAERKRLRDAWRKPSVFPATWGGRECNFGKYVGAIQTGKGQAAHDEFNQMMRTTGLHNGTFKGLKVHWFGHEGYNVFARGSNGVLVVLQGVTLRFTKLVVWRIFHYRL